MNKRWFATASPAAARRLSESDQREGIGPKDSALNPFCIGTKSFATSGLHLRSAVSGQNQKMSGADILNRVCHVVLNKRSLFRQNLQPKPTGFSGKFRACHFLRKNLQLKYTIVIFNKIKTGQCVTTARLNLHFYLRQNVLSRITAGFL